MLDATLPTVAFIVANAVNGLRTGIWAALGAAFLVFVLRLVRRESVQQAVSGLFAVGVAVAIAAASGQARDFFVLGIVRNAVIGGCCSGPSRCAGRWSGWSRSGSRRAISGHGVALAAGPAQPRRPGPRRAAPCQGIRPSTP